MSYISALTAFAAALALSLVAALAWRYVRRSNQLIRELRQRIAVLERERTIKPSPRIAFEYNGVTREALLHVKNDGGDAEFRASLLIEGALAHRVNGEVSALWQHGSGPATMLRRGQAATLRLAQLDLSVFPYAQWQVFGYEPGRGEARPFSVRAMHTSTIGGDPETQAPPLVLQIVLISSPDAMGPVPHCTIALQPFEAVRLQGI